MSSLDVTADTAYLHSRNIVTFIIKITNTGETPLDPVKVQDILPEGMRYVSDNRSGLVQGQNITWLNIGRLDVGASTQIKLVTRINPGITGWLVNFVTVTGTPPTGYNVTDNDTAELFLKIIVVKHAVDENRAMNVESLVVGNQSASAFYSASAINKVTIISSQR
jgi:uncharacterized repeat protein (TIGR01451 family)